MKTNLLTLIFLLGISMTSTSQVTFQKTFDLYGGGNGYNFLETADGGYCAVGSTGAFGSSDVFLLKTDADGDTLWTRIFGGPGDDIGWMFNETADSGFIITGFATNMGAGVEDVYLVRTDSNGDTLWTKNYGGTANDRGNSVEQTNDGGFIITGYTASFGAGGSDLWLIKTDANGDTTWTKTYGGVGSDAGTSVKQTGDGGYIVTGVTSSFGSGNDDLLLMKTNSTGDTLWQKALGGTDNDYGYSVHQTADGGYIVLGYTNSFGAGNDDMYLVKTDSAGDVLWSKTYGGAVVDRGRFLHQTTDGGYIFTGWTYSFGMGNADIFYIKTDANGDTLWTKAIGGAPQDNARSVMQTSDGGYIISGGSDSFNSGTYDLFLIKTDSSGNSGCNHSSPPTVVSSPTTQAVSIAISVSAHFPVITSPSTILDHGAAVTVLCTGVGIKEMPASESFSMYPNPSSGDFVISFNHTLTSGTLEVVNAIGQKIFSERISHASEMKISLENVYSGIYFVRLVDGVNNYSRKIIIVD